MKLVFVPMEVLARRDDNIPLELVEEEYLEVSMPALDLDLVTVSSAIEIDSGAAGLDGDVGFYKRR